MRWPFQTRSDESGRNVGQTVGEVLEQIALGAGDADPKNTAAVIACAGLMARTFAQIEQTPSAVPSADLVALGYEVMRRAVAYRFLDAGELREVTDVRKGSNRRGEVYYKFRLVLPGRDGEQPERTAPADSFIDLRHPAGKPHTSDALIALAELEAWLKTETAAPHGQLIESGRLGSAAALAMFSSLNRLFRKHPGTFAPLPVSSGLNGGNARRVAAPLGLGATLTDEIVRLHTRLSSAACSALGVPPSLIDPAGAGGGATRETSRWFQRSTVEPMTRLLEAELRKLDPSLSLSIAELGGRDIVAMGRTVKTLVDAGMSLDDALEKAGFE